MAGSSRMEGHGGELAVAVARRHHVDTIFTLSGGHVFPVYDAAVRAEPPLRLVDVRHEQTAVFAAEGTAKLTRRPGLAVVTAGPGVTNSVSALASAWFNGSPLVLLGGRAPHARWGSGNLQELDAPPLVLPVTKGASTAPTVADVPARLDEAFRLAALPRRGPVFLDVPADELYARAEVWLPAPPRPRRLEAAEEDGARVVSLLGDAARPVLVLGSDVWADGAEAAARRLAETAELPVVANGMGRGVLPRGHDLLVSRARRRAFAEADLVVVAGTPLDFRLGFGAFGGEGAGAQVVHLVDSPSQLAQHVELAGSAAGDLSRTLDAIAAGLAATGSGRRDTGWASRLRQEADAAAAADAPLLSSDAEPVHPARIYGELLQVLDDDAVVIGDGGDFVSYAGRFVEPVRPGRWLDAGPFGCLGAGLGYAIAARLAYPSAQVVALLGDGAASSSLMDVDTLVRHRLPVVLVVGNNAGWGLEKAAMRPLFGYDVAADLAPQTRYDEVVRALGGAGELVTRPRDIGPALRRAFASAVPYLVNVVTDPAASYPRATTGV